jgi:hypothetical protein
MSQNSIAQLSYQVCPIVLTGGIASQIPGGLMPLLMLFGGGGIDDLDDAFGAFNVLPGGTLVHQTISKYPFANQYVAANASINEALTISVIMDAPMRGPRAWLVKQAVMTSLKSTLESHNNLGGTYTVLTPAYMYDNLVMTSLTDNSRGSSSLPQNAWRFDFEKPLITVSDLTGAYNQLMNKVTNGLPTTGATTGVQPGSAVGQSVIADPGGLAPGTPGTGKPGELGSPLTSVAGQITSNNSIPDYSGTQVSSVFPGSSSFTYSGVS